MKLDFKGIITKEELEKDISNLDPIMENNDYAVVVEDGVGKFVVFSMDFVKHRLELIDEQKSKNRLKKSPFTLVESMIQTLEEIPEKKTTAILLSSLVEKYYGRTVSPVTIRTRAEENANGYGETDYFIIEPGNVIGLEKDTNFTLYMYNKMKRAVEFELNKLFKDEKHIELNLALFRAKKVISHPSFKKYSQDFTNKDIKKMILSIGIFSINNNYIGKTER